MWEYAQLTLSCRRKWLLQFFGEALTTPCQGCDTCERSLLRAEPVDIRAVCVSSCVFFLNGWGGSTGPTSAF